MTVEHVKVGGHVTVGQSLGMVGEHITDGQSLGMGVGTPVYCIELLYGPEPVEVLARA